ncbi:MAG: hypothetical protein K2P59_15980 [Acetatifactor sp.]|nr:hypothetical protein [Acetatifactor sp.]
MNVSLNGSYGNNYGNSYMEPVGYGASRAGNTSGREDIALPGAGNKQEKERKERLGIKDPTEECQTCKNRKYKDGSDEMVSFKSPAHISPESAASAVRSHEQEHVTNAYSKAATGNGKVLSATVSIQTSVCPECGRSYVSGGTTSTQIKYYNEDNPYQKDLKATDHDKYAGMNLDYAV